MLLRLVDFVREYYGTQESIPLHAPLFKGKERQYLADAVDSTFVSSIGGYVDRFEEEVAKYTGAQRAIATVNGTASLHISLKLMGVGSGDLVITQPLTFVATCNAIAYCGAEPVFVDVDRHTLGLSPDALEVWIEENAFQDAEGICRTKVGLKAIRACVPVHTFGHPADLNGLLAVTNRWNIALVEDAAESLGSLYQGRHTGTFGKFGALSFNGNKIITTGGGGVILSGGELASHAKHLITTAKIPHDYEYRHDEIGYNYRLPNLNAALGCAQMEQLEKFLAAKRALALAYDDFFQGSDIEFFKEPVGCRSNYWLNSVICESKVQRDELLKATNDKRVMTRPVWTLMSRLPMYEDCRKGQLTNAESLETRLVNLPSSALLKVE